MIEVLDELIKEAELLEKKTRQELAADRTQNKLLIYIYASTMRDYLEYAKARYEKILEWQNELGMRNEE